MGNHKRVLCKTCCREMRSDLLKRHMKVHEKRTNTIPVSKEDNVSKDDLEKYLLEKMEEFKEKGKQVYRFLGEGKVSEAALSKDMKAALDYHVMSCETFYNENVANDHLLPPNINFYFCDECEYRTVNRLFLREHIKNKHRSSINNQPKRTEDMNVKSMDVFKCYMVNKLSE